MAYITRTDIETFLNITLSTNGQALVDALIPAIEKYVEDQTNRNWSTGASTDITEIFDGNTDTFFPKISPIASVQSVTINGTAYNLSNVYNYSSHLKFSTIAVDLPRTVTIVYRTSANTLPADLKHALIRWVADIFKSQDDAGKTTVRWSEGPVSVEYLAQDGIPKFVEMLINKYRLQPV